MTRASDILKSVDSAQLDFDIGAISVNEVAMLGSLLRSVGLGSDKKGSEEDEISYNSKLTPDMYLAKHKVCPRGYIKNSAGKCSMSKVVKVLSDKTSLSAIDARLDPDEFYRKYRKCPAGYSKTIQKTAFEIMDDPRLRNSRMLICAPDKDERDFMIRTKKFD